MLHLTQRVFAGEDVAGASLRELRSTIHLVDLAGVERPGFYELGWSNFELVSLPPCKIMSLVASAFSAAWGKKKKKRPMHPLPFLPFTLPPLAPPCPPGGGRNFISPLCANQTSLSALYSCHRGGVEMKKKLNLAVFLWILHWLSV